MTGIFAVGAGSLAVAAILIWKFFQPVRSDRVIECVREVLREKTGLTEQERAKLSNQLVRGELDLGRDVVENDSRRQLSEETVRELIRLCASLAPNGSLALGPLPPPAPAPIEEPNSEDAPPTPALSQKPWRFDVQLEADARVQRARDVAADRSLFCINEKSEQLVNDQALYGARTLVSRDRSWQRLGNGTGVTAMFKIPDRDGIYALRQGRVLKLEQGDRAWTTIFTEEGREVADFTIAKNQDLLIQYSSFEVARFAADGEYRKGERLTPGEGLWTLDVGGGKVLAAPAPASEPGPPQIWDGGSFLPFDGGAVADITAASVRLDANGKAALLRAGDGKSFVRPLDGSWIAVADPTTVLYDEDTSLTFVGTGSGAYYIEGQRLVPLESRLEFFQILGIVDLPDGEVLIQTREKGYFRVRAHRG